jgi:hypothetical protein
MDTLPSWPSSQYWITAREIIRRLPRHLGSSARTRLLRLLLLLSDLPFPPYHSCPTCALFVLALFRAPDSIPSLHSNLKSHLVHRLSCRSRENRVPSSSSYQSCLHSQHLSVFLPLSSPSRFFSTLSSHLWRIEPLVSDPSARCWQGAAVVDALSPHS